MLKWKGQIAVGQHLGECETKWVTWEALTKLLSEFKRTSKKGGAYFVGGAFSEGAPRKEDFMLGRWVLTIDIDDAQVGDWGALKWELEDGLDGYAHAIYTTFSHTKQHPKCRVVLPLSRMITPNEYRQLSKTFVQKMLNGVDVDKVSFTPNELMFLPAADSSRGKYSEAIIGDGEPIEVEDFIKEEDRAEGIADWDFTKGVPTELSVGEVDTYLELYPNTPEDDRDYHAWLEVGAALHHQFTGGKDGWDRWMRWSQQNPTTHDPAQMKKKWKSFNAEKKNGRVVTFKTIIWHVNQAGEVPRSKLDTLVKQASELATMGEYIDFRNEVKLISRDLLPDDMRGVIAKACVDVLGKESGLTVASVKQSITPGGVSAHRKQLAIANGLDAMGEEELAVDSTVGFNEDGFTDKGNAPVWLRPWCFVEKLCEFWRVDKVLDGGVKAQAFDAKYGTARDVVTSEVQASRFATSVVGIPTVADVVYWPGADRLLTQDDRLLLNSWSDSGVRPCSVSEMSSERARRAVGIFERHLTELIKSERDRDILISWMAWVYRNPGKKCRWAPVVQGTQGSGKSFIASCMEALLGRDYNVVTPDSIRSTFTDWSEGSRVIAIEEIRESGENRFAIIDKLKAFISNDTVGSEGKGKAAKKIPNFSSYLFFTNYKDGVPLTDNERRFFIIFCAFQTRNQLVKHHGGVDATNAYFDELFAIIDMEGDVIARYLLSYALHPEFTPNGRAPDSEGRRQLLSLMVGEDQDTLVDAIWRHRGTVVNDDFIDITWLKQQSELDGLSFPDKRGATASLQRLGYRHIEGRKIRYGTQSRKKGDNRHYNYVWVHEETELSDSDIETIVVNFHMGVDMADQW